MGLAAESIVQLKLIEFGVPKEQISLLAVPLSLVVMVTPFFIGRYVSTHNKLMVFVKVLGSKYYFILIFFQFKK